MGNHDTPAGSVGVFRCLDRLSESADLVDFQEKGVAGLLLDGSPDADGVGDSQVIAGAMLGRSLVTERPRNHLPNNLEIGSLEEVDPRIPVVLGEWVLDGNDRVLFGELLVEIGQLLVTQPLGRVGVGILQILLERVVRDPLDAN